MLDDLLAPNLGLVICGTAAGRRSAMVGEYYAGHGNKFWRILHETGLTSERLDSKQYKRLLDFRIGLTDIVKKQSGMDDEIDFRGATPEGLREKTERLRPQVLCFNGKRAAKIFYGRNNIEFGLQPGRIGITAVFVAPSTSGAANKTWDSNFWRELANLVNSQLTV
jgi:TDG/mug DNA glycosylase family protein